MYNRQSTFKELKSALEDVSKALAKRPKDKFINVILIKYKFL